MSHLSDTIKHCDTFAEWKDCDKHKDLECYRLECMTCDWTERDCEEEKNLSETIDTEAVDWAELVRLAEELVKIGRERSERVSK